MGFKCFVFCNWTRSCPKGTQEDNEAGLVFFEQIIDELLKHNIEPIVTIIHFDVPLCLADHYDGWCSREVSNFFLFYCEQVFTRFKDKVKYWMTFKEINILRNWVKLGGHATGLRIALSKIYDRYQLPLTQQLKRRRNCCHLH